MQRFFRATIADRCVLKRATEVTGEFKLPVSSSLVAVVAHTISRLPRPQPGKFVFSDSKRVFANTTTRWTDIADLARYFRKVPNPEAVRSPVFCQ
jgi:hypothetical protein